jgi:FG-GAP repeat
MNRIVAAGTVIVLSLGLPIALPAHAAGSSGTTGVAAGDFNGDGNADLAVGAPGEDVGPEGDEIQDGGQVHIIYGSNNGLTGDADQVFTQDTPGLTDEVEMFDGFGQSVAAGDFNGDGRDDLAVGAPGEGQGDTGDAEGVVHILFGRTGGLSTVGDQRWHQDSPGVMQVAEDGDSFGFTLTSGDFGKSTKDDLAIGVPFEGVGNPEIDGAGLVQVLFGSGDGLTAQGDELWHQDVSGVKGVVVDQIERFGFALAAADFGRSGKDDLAIGTYRDSSGPSNEVLVAGAVNVLYGSAAGLTARGDQRWTQDSVQDGSAIKDQSENNDAFGWALAAGNVGKSQFADLAVGAYFEELGNPAVVGAGAVNVIYGGEDGLRARGNQLWTHLTPGIPGSLESANFGNTVAIGNLGKSGVGDLAIGAPLQNVPAANSLEGDITVIYGRKDGLSAQGSQSWSQDSDGVRDQAEGNDNFGGCAAIGDFGRSKHKDLAIGVAGEDSSAGAANVLYGSQSGLSAAGDQFWQQGLNGIKGIAESGDNFAFGLLD